MSTAEKQTHRRRNQGYYFQIDLGHGSSTLQFLQFWNQNIVNILFLVVKSLKVTPGFISKLTKKNSRWRHNWNIWHLSVKTKIFLLAVCYQGFNGCQKNLKNSGLEFYFANIQPKLQKLWSFTRNHSFLMTFGGILNFIQYWLNISALTQQIYL